MVLSRLSPVSGGSTHPASKFRRASSAHWARPSPRWSFTNSCGHADDYSADAGECTRNPGQPLDAPLDEMESKGLIERPPNESDHRRYALSLTTKGKSRLQAMGKIVGERQGNALLSSSSEHHYRNRNKSGGILRRSYCGSRTSRD